MTARKTTSASTKPTGPRRRDETRVTKMEDDDDAGVVASNTDLEDRASTSSANAPVTGRTHWDIVEAVGGTQHLGRVLRELDSMELLAVVTFILMRWQKMEGAPDFYVLFGGLAAYHVVVRPAAGFVRIFIADKLARRIQSSSGSK